MSMTVHIRMKGLTDLELVLEALRQMGKTAFPVADAGQKVRGKTVLAIASINGNRVGFKRNGDGELVMVGDAGWRCMRNKMLHEDIMQQYTVAAVKRKAEELRYSVASVDTLDNGSIRLVARAWG
ncbi:DUF1257 domain-containing protein [Thermodesulfobacteriota bacterium]